MQETLHYKRCIHCNNKITNINENYKIETIYDGVYREFRYCCFKCFNQHYNVEYDDSIKTKKASENAKKKVSAKKGGDNE